MTETDDFNGDGDNDEDVDVEPTRLRGRYLGLVMIRRTHAPHGGRTL